MKQLVFLFLIFLIAYSCKKECNDNGELTNEELSWITYQDGQMLIFENDSSVRETLYVQKNSYYVDFPENDDYCTKSQTVYVKLPIRNNFLMIESRHQISYPKFSGAPNLQTDGSRQFFYDYPDSINIMINNIYYTDVRLIPMPYSLVFRNVYHSKSKGILSYELFSDSSKWSLIN